MTVSASPIVKRAYGSIPNSASCGGHTFSRSDINTAINTGVNDNNSGSSPSGYPHAYYQYADEHITLSCNDASDYLEFPLENNRAFTGGSPGAYRAIFTEDGEFCAVVYHASTSDNSFAQCRY
ncbi:ribonuclease T1 [Jaminaea rosea]|uniref:Ribonuclease T1 n=1 Tax=Jaminaea rosea TaxID=1569628 RepID=A0A316UR21_9BASI|nr:ribonuclease T1 [Jaminaea rosea]PWN25575.1 ribonuclease T1 [Jaminaea rosea]